MKNAKNLAIILSIAGAIALPLVQDLPIKSQKICSTYEGIATEKNQSRSNRVIFNDDMHDKRRSIPLIIKANQEVTDSMRVGREYCFEIETPLAPWRERYVSQSSLRSYSQTN